MDTRNSQIYFDTHIRADQPAAYALYLQGRIDGADLELNDWFRGQARCAIERGADGEPISVLEGVLADQAALHGLLARIRDLNLILLRVDCLSARAGLSGSPIVGSGEV